MKVKADESKSSFYCLSFYCLLLSSAYSTSLPMLLKGKSSGQMSRRGNSFQTKCLCLAMAMGGKWFLPW